MAFLLGMLALTLFLLAYYKNKVRQKKSPGLIGVQIALLTYATGPTSVGHPQWFLVLLAISILLVLHSKGRNPAVHDRPRDRRGGDGVQVPSQSWAWCCR